MLPLLPRVRRLTNRSIAALPLLVTVSFITVSAQAATWRVNVQGTGDAPTIQAALDAASPGDTVLVAPGHYTWTNQGTGDSYGLIRYWLSDSDEVALVSEGGPAVTIIDAEYQGRVFFANGNNIAENPVDFLIDGFTFRGGVAPSYENRPEREGGAMALHLVYPVIRNCVFTDNDAETGGAVWAGGVSSIRFEDCRFVGNRVSTVRQMNPVGGGVFVVNSSQLTTFERCTFEDNVTPYRGGGAFIANARVNMIDCVFVGNRSTHPTLGKGTGLYVLDAHAVNFDRIIVRENESPAGAAVYIRKVNNPLMTATLTNSIVAFNSGLSIDIEGIAVTVQCTNIFGNPGGDWAGSLASRLGVTGNVRVDPLFCATSEDKRRVEPTSPMLAGHNTCNQDIGGVVEGCSGVAVVVSDFRAGWSSDRAYLQLDFVDETARPERLRVTRVERNGIEVPADLEWIADGGALRALDPAAPLDGASYELRLDEGTDVLARAELPARGPVLARTAIVSIAPNPFNPRAVIEWSVARDGDAAVRIYDLRGRLVTRLHDAAVVAGTHTSVWDGTDASGESVVSGVYVVEVAQDGRSERQKLALVR